MDDVVLVHACQDGQQGSYDLHSTTVDVSRCVSCYVTRDLYLSTPKGQQLHIYQLCSSCRLSHRSRTIAFCMHLMD